MKNAFFLCGQSNSACYEILLTNVTNLIFLKQCIPTCSSKLPFKLFMKAHFLQLKNLSEIGVVTSFILFNKFPSHKIYIVFLDKCVHGQ